MAKLYVNDVLVDPDYKLRFRNKPTWPEEHDNNVVVITATGIGGTPIVQVPQSYWGESLGRDKVEVTWCVVLSVNHRYHLPKAYLLEQMLKE